MSGVVARPAAALLLAVLGAAGLVLGEGDDSPGLQLLGVLLVLGAVVAARGGLRAGRPRG